MQRDKKHQVSSSQSYRTKISCPDCNRLIASFMYPGHRRSAHPISTPMPKARPRKSKPKPIFDVDDLIESNEPITHEPITHFPTGATRSKLNIGRVDLIVPEMLHGLGHRLELGAETHGERNWEKGITYVELIAHTQHHLSEFAKALSNGLVTFPQTQQDVNGNDTVYGHACALLCNAAFIVTFVTRGNPAEKK